MSILSRDLGIDLGTTNVVIYAEGRGIVLREPSVVAVDKNTGKVLTHTFITQKIWGSSWENDIASLRVFMATLRKKLEAGENSPQYIQTHIGVGYRMLRVDGKEKNAD